MRIAIIVSLCDLAGINIKECLLELYPFKELGEPFCRHPVYSLCSEFHDARLYTVETDSIFCEGIDRRIGADLFIFATKHQSKSGIPSLSVHAPGNWAMAELGGRDKELCVAPASWLREGLLKLVELVRDRQGVEVVQECTHHGPYLEAPCMFIEIGPSEKEWRSREYGEIIAHAVHHLLAVHIPEREALLGIGGLHTAPNLCKVVLNTGYALGHVCPKYMLEGLDEGMVRQAVERTSEPVELIVVDWKGLGSHKEKVRSMLDSVGIRWLNYDKLY